ncbi:MAG: hypothetical protein MUE71_03735 [Chitinophagaceae bacterium]|jgi:hypothetical protein|nr:hypothetical protein [Chitinophagaceae bacterium]
MHNEHHTSHLAQGFGKNTNGMGIFIVAVVFVAISLFTWWLWNNDHKETDHYRFEKVQTKAESHKGH